MTLAEQIKQVMELDAKRTQGEWGDVCPDYYDGEAVLFLNFDEKNRIATGHDESFIGQTPTMASIIRQLTDIVKQQHEALDSVKQYMLEQTMGHRAGTHPREMQVSVYQALAQSAPIVKEIV